MQILSEHFVINTDIKKVNMTLVFGEFHNFVCHLLIRKGAPYYARFLQLMSRLEDTGIINYWTQEVISKRIRENRKTAEPYVLVSLRDLSEVSAHNVIK